MNNKKNNAKVFVIFNTSNFGDVLACNTLCQNIKRIYPDSKIVFVTKEAYIEVAKYQKDVDEAFCYNRKSILSKIQFILTFPYKRPYCCINPYRFKTNEMFSRLLHPKFILSVLKQKGENLSPHIQYRTAQLLQEITDKKIEFLPIRYNANNDFKITLRQEGKKYIGLCTVSANKEKDMPLETAVSIINKLAEKGCETVLCGAGNTAKEYAEQLKKCGCNFIDYVNKTTIKELSGLIKSLDALISIDTGVMHMACAVETPVTAVFYKHNLLSRWAPPANIYKSIVISENQTPDNIIKSLQELITT